MHFLPVQLHKTFVYSAYCSCHVFVVLLLALYIIWVVCHILLLWFMALEDISCVLCISSVLCLLMSYVLFLTVMGVILTCDMFWIMIPPVLICLALYDWSMWFLLPQSTTTILWVHSLPSPHTMAILDSTGILTIFIMTVAVQSSVHSWH